MDRIQPFLTLDQSSTLSSYENLSSTSLDSIGNHHLKGSRYAKHATAPSSPSDIISKSTYDTGNNGASKTCSIDTHMNGSPIDRTHPNEGTDSKRMSRVREIFGKYFKGRIESDSSKRISASSSSSSLSSLIKKSVWSRATHALPPVSTGPNKLAPRHTRSQQTGLISYLSHKLSLSSIKPANQELLPKRHQESPATIDLIRSGQRLTPYLERIIYRMSHAKLTNSRRPLREQVVISNLMFWYLSLISTKYQQLQRIIQGPNHQQIKSPDTSNDTVITLQSQAYLMSPLPFHLLDNARLKRPSGSGYCSRRSVNSDTRLSPSPLSLESRKNRYKPIRNSSFNQNTLVTLALV